MALPTHGVPSPEARMVKARLHASFNIDGRHQPGCALRHEEGNRFSVEIERTVAGTYRVDLMVAGRHVEGLQTRAPLPAASPDTRPTQPAGSPPQARLGGSLCRLVPSRNCG